MQVTMLKLQHLSSSELEFSYNFLVLDVIMLRPKYYHIIYIYLILFCQKISIKSISSPIL